MDQRFDSSSEQHSSPERDLLGSHPVDFTPSVSPASTRASSPDRPYPWKLLGSGITPPSSTEQSHLPQGQHISDLNLTPRSLQGDMDAVTPHTATPSDGIGRVATKQGLAIRTRPAAHPRTAASPTTDIIDGLLGEVVQGRLTRDTPDHKARASRLQAGQERMSILEGDKSGELKVLSPESGTKKVEKPPQNLPLPVVSPKSTHTAYTSPFSSSKATEVLEEWADRDLKVSKDEPATVASFALSQEGSGHKQAASASDDGTGLPPFIRRSEENMQLIVGDKPGEFELMASQGRRFSFSADDGVHEMPAGLMQDFGTLKIEPAAQGSSHTDRKHGVSDLTNLLQSEVARSSDAELVEGQSPKSTSTPNSRKRDRDNGPFVEVLGLPKPVHPRLSVPSPDAEPQIPGFSDASEPNVKPSAAERLVRDGIDVADPSGAIPSLTPNPAQVAQATAIAGGKVDAITGHSTLEAEDLGLPRNSVDLMSGITGGASPNKSPRPGASSAGTNDVKLPPIISQPRSGISIPEGSTVPDALVDHVRSNSSAQDPSQNSNHDAPLRVNLPDSRVSPGSASPITNAASPQASPVHPSFVETPSRIMDATSHISRQQPSVDARHVHSAAENLRRAVEGAGISTLIPVIREQSEKLRQQYSPKPDIFPASSVPDSRSTQPYNSGSSPGSAKASVPSQTATSVPSKQASTIVYEPEFTSGQPASTTPVPVTPGSVSKASDRAPTVAESEPSGRRYESSQLEYEIPAFQPASVAFEPASISYESEGMQRPMESGPDTELSSFGDNQAVHDSKGPLPTVRQPEAASVSYEESDPVPSAKQYETGSVGYESQTPLPSARQTHSAIYEPEYESNDVEFESKVPLPSARQVQTVDYEIEEAPPSAQMNQALPPKSIGPDIKSQTAPAAQSYAAVPSNVVFESDEDEKAEVLPSHLGSEFKGHNVESPLLRPGAGLQAQKQAEAASKFDDRVLPNLDTISTERAQISAVAPPTPHAPEATSPGPFGSPIQNQKNRVAMRPSSGLSETTRLAPEQPVAMPLEHSSAERSQRKLFDGVERPNSASQAEISLPPVASEQPDQAVGNERAVPRGCSILESASSMESKPQPTTTASPSQGEARSAGRPRFQAFPDQGRSSQVSPLTGSAAEPASVQQPSSGAGISEVSDSTARKPAYGMQELPASPTKAQQAPRDTARDESSPSQILPQGNSDFSPTEPSQEKVERPLSLPTKSSTKPSKEESEAQLTQSPFANPEASSGVSAYKPMTSQEFGQRSTAEEARQHASSSARESKKNKKKSMGCFSCFAGSN